ncbi:endonuclease/exonuclease/phosphatase family protein [Paenibacillus sp. MER 99-2]|uniref:endonuclease/exonuclease/phosphatase family protein n=1 Tax=Paenibacillus sp. MER 99-2 TaxID=2939572 RepID=UPI00203C64C4|nr:endonuclease/exonuclease/phosphatase family protein [Paenibacillus sp. MER 99-2]MCM3175709.1 endonuclease/exonuclease/phosphatase family protein [Paenibacillus sp. MER 99-2]
MKILTLNAHAWAEENQLNKISQLAEFINTHQFDIISMQEVNQPIQEEALTAAELEHYFRIDSDTVVKKDNYAYVLLTQLSETYYWTWIPTHVGFRTYDEGLAILSRTPITQAFGEYVSHMQDYNNYRTRKIVGIQTVADGEEAWFVNGHYNWWDDDQEPFKGQWDLTESKLAPYMNEPLYMMGDFNNVAEIREQGYDYMMSHGWHDLYTMAKQKDDGATVVKAIAGWANNSQPLRIDYIFSNRPVQAKSSTVVLNGKNGPVVSDHYGVAVEIDMNN